MIIVTKMLRIITVKYSTLFGVLSQVVRKLGKKQKNEKLEFDGI